MNPVLADNVFKQLRDFIYEKSGIFISDAKKYLVEKKLVTRLQERNLNSFEDYLSLLKYGSTGDELNKLYDSITTNETYFFREPQQLSVCAGRIGLPGHLDLAECAEQLAHLGARCFPLLRSGIALREVVGQILRPIDHLLWIAILNDFL